MPMRKNLPSPTRRYAAGIDIGSREVRLVIAGRARRESAPLRVEWMGAAPLEAGATSGAQVVDRAAVSFALASLCARMPRRRAMRCMPWAMALPVDDSEGAALERNRHLEARVEAAAAAGIALAAVDNEAQAALRALVHAAERTWRKNGRFAAVWAGCGGVRAWRVADGAVSASIRFPGTEHVDPESALRVLAGNEGLERALVGGDLTALERVGMALADIGECLGCTVVPFECASLGTQGAVVGRYGDWRRAASYAVAFGLALRGVSS